MSEERLAGLVERELGAFGPVVLVAEGLPGGRVLLPRGRSESEAALRVIVDPIDGTRGLMYQKRSAWILTGVAPNRGPATSLRDLVAAVQNEILRDRVALDEASQKTLAEQLHHRVIVPRRERVKRAIVREGTVGREDVSMRMPLQKVTSAGDRDHDARPRVRSDLSSHVLGEGLGSALRQVEEKLSPLPP